MAIRRLRVVTVLAASGLLAAGAAVAAGPGSSGGGHIGGGGAHFGGEARAGGGFGGYGNRGFYRGGYYGRGFYGGYARPYGWGCCGWGWWGPGWWGVGAFVTWLPWYYSLYWWNGYPYYYYSNTYYVWNGDVGQYQQVNPPQDFNPNTASTTPPNGAAAPPSNTELFAYPKAGQSPEQQARDRDECSRWAAGETGQQASQAPPGAQPAPGAGATGAPAGAPSAGQQSNQAAPAQGAVAQRDAYLRAEAACLQARNYTVQ